MSIFKQVLDNGVRVLCEPVSHVRSAAVGLWCATGSKNETEHEGGVTHLIEHMLFKGTERRTAKQIAEEIEGRGGMLNAFTDKESTCYYCRVLADDLPVAIDVLGDMLCHSKLDVEELEREKKVVLEEIKRGEDEPSDHVHDMHMIGRWGAHPLGRPIIGTAESVASFSRNSLETYMARRYLGGHVLLSVAGNVDPEQVVRLADAAVGRIEMGSLSEPVDRPKGVAGRQLIGKDVEQVHFCIGTDGPSIYDAEFYVAAALDGCLGGGMSSRLFQEIRERRGLAYAVGSYCLNYAAGGAFTVYGGTSRENWDQVEELVRKEFDKVCAGEPGDEELAKIKRNLSGNLVLALEGMGPRMMRMARNEINHGREVPIEETLARLEAVTRQDLIDLARRVLRQDLISVTAIGPFAA